MILVTGATGNNGSEIVKQLSAAGAPVRALVRNPAKAAAIKGPNVEIFEGDLGKPATLDAAMAGVERVLLCSGFSSDEVDMQGNMVKAARRAGSPHMVKFSVIGADPTSPYRILSDHGQIEKQIEASGLPFTHLRPNSFMQNLLMFAGSIKQGSFALPAGEARMSTVDIRDIAAVAVQVLTGSGHEGKTYDITGPEALSYGDMARKLTAVLGRPIQYINLTPADFKSGMLQWGVPEWMADGMNELYASYTGYQAAVTDVVARIGKKPPTTFDQFARDFASVFQG
jgi:uncharacterized protein YbjT (DUF2867 family)